MIMRIFVLLTKALYPRVLKVDSMLETIE